MSIPSPCFQADAKYLLITGERYRTYIDEDEEDGAAGVDAGAVVRIDCAPLVLLWVGQSRNFGIGNSRNPDGSAAASGSITVGPYGSPGLRRFDADAGAETGYRWSRTCELPGTSVNWTLAEPISNFEIESWAEALSEGGWGGAALSVSVPDNGVYGGLDIFVEDRAVSVYVIENEDGVEVSATELFTGYIDAVEYVKDPDNPVYRLGLATIEKRLGRAGMDGGDTLFVDQQFQQSIFDGTVLPPSEESVATGGLSGVPVLHVRSPLTLGGGVDHLMRWHLHALVDGSNRYPLRSLVDLVRDVWNDGDPTVYRVGQYQVAKGNLMDQLRGFLPQGIWYAYGIPRGGIAVTRAQEMKTSGPDASLGTIDKDQLLELVYMPGPGQITSQVEVIQTPITYEEELTEEEAQALIVRYPATADSAGTKREISVPYFFTTEEAGQDVAEGYYRIDNSNDRVRMRMIGAPLSIFNIFELDSDLWVVERVRHIVGSRENFGPHQTEVIGRLLDV